MHGAKVEPGKQQTRPMLDLSRLLEERISAVGFQPGALLGLDCVDIAVAEDCQLVAKAVGDFQSALLESATARTTAQPGGWEGAELRPPLTVLHSSTHVLPGRCSPYP